eukprot:TRINITY_DN34434_c0_g1_i1.p1 TRINITY_DN34434_c0_g1~~TRINITY_DN34434_c0_g1_i1.p1  ORF type:complete len:299 (-),score=58.40 TRINITY_DN34434_c0_g1_i1:242-1111(-)
MGISSSKRLHHSRVRRYRHKDEDKGSKTAPKKALKGTWGKLHDAAEQGDLATACQCLSRDGADPNLGDESGWTPLLEASELGHFAVAEALLCAKADPNLGDDAGKTPLALAAEHKELEVVRILLDAGADPTLGDNCWSLLLEACDSDHAPVIEMLRNAKMRDSDKKPKREAEKAKAVLPRTRENTTLPATEKHPSISAQDTKKKIMHNVERTAPWVDEDIAVAEDSKPSAASKKKTAHDIEQAEALVDEDAGMAQNSKLSTGSNVYPAIAIKKKPTAVARVRAQPREKV